MPMSATEAPDAPTAERALRDRAHALFEELRKSHPEFYAYMDDGDPMLASRGELVTLMERAPNDAIFMFLYANFSMRLELALITGRGFS